MPHHARNHNQNRRRVCIICMKKGSDKITDLVLGRIHNHVQGLENYDPMDPRFPNAICGSCRNILADVSNGKKNSSVLPKLKAFNYEMIIHTFMVDSIKCKCYICQVARQKVQSHQICITPPVKGKGNPNFLRDQYGRATNDHDGIETKFLDQQPSTSKKVSNISNEMPSINASDLKEMRTTLGLSKIQTMKVTQIIRTKLGRKSIEPNIDLGLKPEKHMFKENIYCDSMDMEIK